MNVDHELPEGPGQEIFVSPEIKAEKRKAKAKKQKARVVRGKIAADKRKFNVAFLEEAKVQADAHQPLLRRLAET